MKAKKSSLHWFGVVFKGVTVQRQSENDLKNETRTENDLQLLLWCCCSRIEVVDIIS